MASPPIPTYEEATSSNPEQQRLLGAEPDTGSRRPNGYYRPPSCQSVRSSEDSLQNANLFLEDDDILPSDTDSDSAEGLRREIDQMDVVDPDEPEDGDTRARYRNNKWYGRILGFKRRLGRWKKHWAWRWRTPRFLQIMTVWTPTFPERWKNYLPSAPIAARLLGLMAVILVGYILFVMQIPSHSQTMIANSNPEGVRIYAQESVDVNRIRKYLQYYTSSDHLAGTTGDMTMANSVLASFQNAGLDEARIDEYYVYLNFPRPDGTGRRVAITQPPELAWEAKLEEDPVYTDDPSAPNHNTPVFHGHSKSGTVSGPLVYCNYGSRADYKQMYDSGIDINGSIALVRYYGSQSDRALKVKAAEEWGVKGVLIYSDPADDGFVKGSVWPEGRWRPADAVQRGAVSLVNWIVGDVLTPGWASTKDAKRLPLEGNAGLTNIPSLPLAWRDAQRLLQVLKGHGQQLDDSWGWNGGVPDVEWWTGDKSSPVVELHNELDERIENPIFNVIGVIRGVVEPEKQIIVGNHRDSWCFGSGDQASGTAVMLEVIAILGSLMSQGWRPLRSIVFASWDAKEYNLIGSTEFVEDHMDELRQNAIAYLNVDVGVVGPNFRASASPLYQHALLRVLDRVGDPRQNVSLRQVWEQQQKEVDGLGADSDYAAFQHMAGTSSIDFGFTSERPHAYPYHSCYETIEWMEQFGDPGLESHQMLAQIWILLILELSSEPILPFNLNDYAAAILGYITDLQSYSEDKGAALSDENGIGGFDLAEIYEAVHFFTDIAKRFHSWEDWWFGQVIGSGGFETRGLEVQRIAHNARLADFDTTLLDIPENGVEGDQHGVSQTVLVECKY